MSQLTLSGVIISDCLFVRGADLTHIFTGLSSSTEYHYRVKCSNNIGSSQWSPIVTVSTTRMYSDNDCLMIGGLIVIIIHVGHAVTSEHLHKAIQNNDLDMIRNIIEDKLVYSVLLIQQHY